MATMTVKVGERVVVRWNGLELTGYRRADGSVSLNIMSAWGQLPAAMAAGIVSERYLGLGVHASDLTITTKGLALAGWCSQCGRERAAQDAVWCSACVREAGMGA